MRFSRSWLVAVALVAVTLVFAACGDDDDGSTSNGGSDAADSGAPAGGASQETIDVWKEYAGGTEGEADSSLEPLKVGMVVQKGGTPSFPEMEAAADAGVEFVNKHMGGADGHPIELVKCFMQAEEDGQKCGSQLLKADVPVGMFTIAVVGNTSLYETINARIPLIDSVTTLPIDTTTENVYNFAGGAPAILYAKAADGAELASGGRAAIVSVDNAGGKFATEDITVPSFKSLGVEHTKPVYFPDDATTPDMVSALQAAGGADADVILLEPSGPQHCNSLYDAMNQLGITGTPVVATSICGAPSFVDDAANGAPEGWRIWGFVLNSYIESDPEVKAYKEIMESGGQGEFSDVGFSATVLRDLSLLVRFANNLGADGWTPEGFKKEIRSYDGRAFLAPGRMSCSDPVLADQPGLCGREAVGASFTDGEWQTIDPVAVNTEIFGQ